MTSNQNPLFFLVAGEESGDIHGAKLMEQISVQCPEASFMGHGGDKMKAAGLDIIEHVDDLAMMGFTEVIKHLPYMLNVMGQTLGKIREARPNRLILIDYPGFNLRLAKNIHPLGIPITYFILPQVWAWKEKRVKTIRRCVDQALCIFPFEQQWFEEHGINAHFVGHPFTDLQTPSMSRDDFFREHGLRSDKPVLVLFPGSRQQEVDNHLPIFEQSVSLLDNDLQVIVGKAPQVDLGNIPVHWAVEESDTRLCLEYGTAVLTSSGTATLQSAVHDIPAVVSYKMSGGSWWLAKHLTNVPFAAMSNLIVGKRVVPEFLQKDMTPANLADAVQPLLNDSPERKNMLRGYEKIRRTLGIPGAYERAAETILTRIKI
ncbi:MAG TPA: lipid-A-disaccharide synthase [Candidatus Marinimicrobia bacterium]|mgnify:CR=1 FL=1|jgi:lipid-A-disaccharide synthase|nr:lipid-A-disaccharide synthase [Candidatus Neomarinimicrobiota bacterium]MDP7330223.1 lipid-A-disaccharide synthase [Candidatus Neomarinimicrobiota bacterium]HBN45869.1 lipid-A-disaccharide synthase [Candidatus Neomarinimicrobiota bacterium]HJL74416.1 lipid-A-disaccharide synthase [Candidatus Neomarinimicrobiota bacterium]HJM69276.1 lipid-A-disaccharide synthase [Candidatus Neomarinimicrobiota bacterium]|tara:strand:- start:12558 stop:13676 length:1119 start_codon:yes stop_codon:yes gene_type:complete